LVPKRVHIVHVSQADTDNLSTAGTEFDPTLIK